MITFTIPMLRQTFTLLDGEVLTIEGRSTCLMAMPYHWPAKPARPLAEIFARLEANRAALHSLEARMA